MEIDISRLPYKHRFAAASMLMSKGNRLTELTALRTEVSDEKEIQRILQGLSFYDMALSLMKPHDPNFQTLLNCKCLALISLGQFEDARRWYEELVRVAIESEGRNGLGPTARLALDQIDSLAGQHNKPLPHIDEKDVHAFDDPPFCHCAEEFCRLLQKRKFSQAHRYLSPEFGKAMTSADLNQAWSSMVGSANGDTTITLEQYELSTESSEEGHVGWCYFSVTSEDVSEAISMDIYRGSINIYEIGAVEFGRP